METLYAADRDSVTAYLDSKCRPMTLVWSFADVAIATVALDAIVLSHTCDVAIDKATNNLYIEREAAYPAATMRTAYCTGICRGIAFALHDASIQAAIALKFGWNCDDECNSFVALVAACDRDYGR